MNDFTRFSLSLEFYTIASWIELLNMFQPESYINSNYVQRRDAKVLLGKHLSKLNWKNDGSDTLLDIGSGTGDVTIDYIKPLLPENFKMIIGCDKSIEMVKFCREKYENERIKFFQLDIEEDCFAKSSRDSLQYQKIEKFNGITSLYTLQWVMNQR